MADDHWLFFISANKCLYITCQKSWVWTMPQWFAKETDRRMWNSIYLWDFSSSSGVSVSWHTLRPHRRKAFGTIWAPLLEQRNLLCAAFCRLGIRCSKGIWRALKKLMSTDFSYMVISGCARASRATVATFPGFCEYRSWLNYRLGASLNYR